MGMSEFEIITRIELPLAVTTIMTGVRTRAINIIATASIAPLAGVITLGDFVLARNVYGDDGGARGRDPDRAAGGRGRAWARRRAAPAHPTGLEAGTGALRSIGSRRPLPRDGLGADERRIRC